MHPLTPCARGAQLGLGNLHADKGEVSAARRAYSRAAFTHPASPDPLVHLARLYHHLAREEDAHRMVERALLLSPADADALEARAVLRLGRGERTEALADITAAVRADGSGPPEGTSRWKSLLCTAAAIHGSLANRQDAARLYGAALQCHAGSSLALVGLASLELHRGAWSNAADLYEGALALLDADDERFAVSGTALTTEALVLVPRARAAAAAAAEPSAGGGDEAFAKSDAGSLARLRALRGRAALGAGVAHLRLGRSDAAARRLHEAVALRPHCARTHFDRGVLHMLAGAWEPAERDFGATLKLMPLNAEAWLRKSQSVVSQESIVEAGRKRQVLVDYANALLILDYHEEQQEAVRAERKRKERDARVRARNARQAEAASAALEAFARSQPPPPPPPPPAAPRPPRPPLRTRAMPPLVLQEEEEAGAPAEGGAVPSQAPSPSAAEGHLADDGLAAKE